MFGSFVVILACFLRNGRLLDSEAEESEQEEDDLELQDRKKSKKSKAVSDSEEEDEGPPSHSRATKPRDQPAQRNGKRSTLHSHDHRTGALIHQRRKPGSRYRPGRWPTYTTSLLTKKIQIECDVNCEENKI
ncbi:uncharacterized protein LOC6052619 isoform X2 [Culex quinquefasciatus]|uniref:uncharacterized protein LOC6052619 isoform X2 n=1 Tax=Culex quinquefasciatus TaxID=7176 RepID=UPI0018E30969|nr:uncharacterized protein LOC6052619 isoform X2 [Culex quinquefasciatus]